MLVKVIFLIIFFAVMIGVGLYSRKHATNVNDFVLGGRSVGPWLTAFAYGTSYFSAVVFVGYAGQFGYKYGLASTWIGIGNALIGSLLAWVILGRRTRIMSNHLSAATMPDYFGKRYNSKALRIAASAIAFVFLIPYTASVYNGLSRLFGMAFDIPYEVCVIVMAVLTCAYVILGGYMATAINDFIQGIVMLVGIVAVIAAVLSGHGGFMEAVRSLSELESDVAITMGQKGAFASFFGPDPLNLLGVIILTSLGTWGLPQMIHKFYAIKDEKSIQSGTIISTFFAVIVSGGCYFLGGFGRLFDTAAIHKEDGSVIYDAIIPEMLSTLPDILVGVVIVLVLSASMSTLSSLVLTSSSTLIKNSFFVCGFCWYFSLYVPWCWRCFHQNPSPNSSPSLWEFLGEPLQERFLRRFFMGCTGKVSQGQQFGQVLPVVLALLCLTCFYHTLRLPSMQERLL